MPIRTIQYKPDSTLDTLSQGENLYSSATDPNNTSGKTGQNELRETAKMAEAAGHLAFSGCHNRYNQRARPLIGSVGNKITEVATERKTMKIELLPGVTHFTVALMVRLKYYVQGATTNEQFVRLFLSRGIWSQHLLTVYAFGASGSSLTPAINTSTTGVWSGYRTGAINSNIILTGTQSEEADLIMEVHKTDPGKGPVNGLGVAYWDGLLNLDFKTWTA